MSNESPILQLPKEVISRILGYLPQPDRLTFRLVCSTAKLSVDNHCGLSMAFYSSDDDEKVHGAKHLRFETLRIYKITQEHLPLVYPKSVKNLYLYNPDVNQVLHNLMDQLSNVRKLKVYGDLLERQHLAFRNDMSVFGMLEDLRLFYSNENDPSRCFSSIMQILSFQFLKLKSLSIDFYCCPSSLTQQLTEKILTFTVSSPQISTLKLRLQETIQENEQTHTEFDLHNEIKSFKTLAAQRIPLNIRKFHLFADIQHTSLWTKFLISLHKLSSLNLRFLNTYNKANAQVLTNEILNYVLTCNAKTLSEVRLGELSSVKINGSILPFNMNIFSKLTGLKVLKLSRSPDDILYNEVNQNSLPFLCNIHCIPKCVKSIVIYDCTFYQSEFCKMLNGMTNLHSLIIRTRIVSEDIGTSYSNVKNVISDNPSLKYLDVGPVQPTVDRLDYSNEFANYGITETVENDGSILLSYCKDGYAPKVYIE